MAQFKPRQGPKLPAPPAPEVASQNLRAPEVAPAPAGDGRTARATGRTKQLATRVREEFHDELRLYAAEHRLKLVEVLELGFEALKRES
jgi:hypothetical protein